MIYLSEFYLPNAEDEEDFLYCEKRTCFNTFYPFMIFPELELEELVFEPVTIFYGGNGTGKSTLLNIIAETLKLKRNAVFNKSNFFNEYIKMCESVTVNKIPSESQCRQLKKNIKVIYDFEGIFEICAFCFLQKICRGELELRK